MRRIVLLLLTLSGSAFAQSSEPTPVLVPVFFGGPGALGSMWVTQLTIVNNSDQSILEIPYRWPCAIPEGCDGPLPAHASVAARTIPGTRYNTGFFLYPSEARAKQVAYALRVFDESRSGETYGTAVPVVPMSAFRETELILPDIPTSAAFRLTLRIYAAPDTAPLVRVRLYEDPAVIVGSGQPPSVVISERAVTVAPSPDRGEPRPFQRPASAVIDQPQGSDIGDRTGSRFRFGVQSLTAGIPIWALLSVTNNETQHVTMIAPNP
jgi:hypothetical protein